MPSVHITRSAFGGESPDTPLSLKDVIERHQIKGAPTIVDSPSTADIILFTEHHEYKPPGYVDTLVGNTLIQQYPEKCFVHNFDDLPCMFLPGAYVSPIQSLTKNRLHFPSVYLHNWNETVKENEERRSETSHSILASFTGTLTATCREALVKVSNAVNDPAILTIDTSPKDQFFKHTRASKEHYTNQILSSAFALCPRGLGTMTYRLLDAMQLGRCPIIIADDWLRPAGPVWDQFSITAKENEIAILPDLLRENEHRAEELGKLARQAWEKHFSPGAALTHGVAGIQKIQPHCTAEDRSRKAIEKRHQEWLRLWHPQLRFPRHQITQTRQFLGRAVRRTLGIPTPKLDDNSH